MRQLGSAGGMGRGEMSAWVDAGFDAVQHQCELLCRLLDPLHESVPREMGAIK